MKKFSYALILLVVAALALTIGFSLADNKQSNTLTDSDATPTASSGTTSFKEDVPISEAVSVSEEANTSAVSEAATVPTPPQVISPSEAKALALNAAGFDSADVWDKEVELDYENGSWIYEVSFEKNNTDYEYIINALNGEILFSEIDPY